VTLDHRETVVRTLLAFIGASLLLAALPTVAGAATAQRIGDRVVLSGTDAQEYITVGSYNHTIYFEDTLGGAITAVDGSCTQSSSNAASISCGSSTVGQIEVSLAGGPDKITIDTRDGGDYSPHALVYGLAVVRGGAGHDILTGGELSDDIDGEGDDDEVRGGPGNDVLKGGDGPDKLDNDQYQTLGDDSFDGGPGDDLMWAGEVSDGADTISGGPGLDSMSYFFRPNSASTAVTLDGQANDGDDPDHNGVSDERDNVKVDVESAVGGAGSDFLQGNPTVANYLQGEGGDDRIDALQGDAGDNVYCGSGVDTVKADAGDTIVEGVLDHCETVDRPGGSGPGATTNPAPGPGGSTPGGGGPGGGSAIGPNPIVSAASSQRLRANSITLTASCAEACTFTTRGSTVSVPGAAKVYKLKTVTKRLAAGKKAKLKVKLPAKAARAVKRALRKGKTVRARLYLTSYYPDPSGRVGGPILKKVRLRR
jgi:hemolysin type calcium-binding protein